MSAPFAQAIADNARPRVSILLCVYNGMPYLPEVLEALLRQTFRDFELVAVEDGSRDESLAVLREHAGRDARVRVVENPRNLGLVKSLNRGLGECRAPLVARADADDVCDRTRLEKQVAFLGEHPEVGVLGCAFHRVDPRGRIMKTVRPPTEDRHIRFRQLFMSSFVHSGVMFRRGIVQGVGGYDEACVHMEDADLWARLRPKTRFANLPEVLVEYRVHPTSIMQTRDDAAKARSLGVSRRLLEAYLGRPVSPEEGRAVVTLYQGYVPMTAEEIARGLKGLRDVRAAARTREVADTRRFFRREAASGMQAQAYLQGERDPKLRASLRREAVRWWPPTALHLLRTEMAPRLRPRRRSTTNPA